MGQRPTWELEVTAEFEAWWNGLTAADQERVGAVIDQLERRGPALEFPYSSAVVTSRHSGMRELRVQCRGRPVRILYAFDPRRVGVLLLGGDKTGDNRWYSRMVPRADRLFDTHLASLPQEP